MVKICEICFRKAGKVYFFDPSDINVNKGDSVVVETARGLELGTCKKGNYMIESSKLQNQLKKIIRIATQEDIDNYNRLKIHSAKAFRMALGKIKAHKLQMKLIDVEYTLDEAKIIFYFSAEGRVDFRELVKDLAGMFKKRIELHQIGVRDETKLMGGLGQCGQVFCCSRFLNDFDSVCISMAKDQNLALNPVKISGSCGRLMCCLRYENEFYVEARKNMPAIGSIVVFEGAVGEVVEYNTPKLSVIIQFPSKARTEAKKDLVRLATEEEKANFKLSEGEDV